MRLFKEKRGKESRENERPPPYLFRNRCVVCGNSLLPLLLNSRQSVTLHRPDNVSSIIITTSTIQMPVPKQVIKHNVFLYKKTQILISAPYSAHS